MNSIDQAPFLELPFLPRDVEVLTRDDGVVLMRSRVPLATVQAHLPGVLHRQAAQRPHRDWLKQRREGVQGWATLTYGEAARDVDAVAAWLLSLGQAGRNVMVLSGNTLEHAVFGLAAMQARMPYAPITPAYSLLSGDFSKLKQMVALLRPAVIFVQEAQRYARALKALDLRDTVCVYVSEPAGDVAGVPWQELVATTPGAAVADSMGLITHDTVAKYLFTSGSTGVPKAVPVTQGMLCSTMAMHSQTVQRRDSMPEAVLLEWLPWSHVAGGTAIFNSVLEEGGTMFIDDGRPVPGDFARTLRNLQDVAPTRFSSVPAGYAMLAQALERDDSLARNFFSQLGRLTSSGAKLPESIYGRMQQLAVRHRGGRIPFVAGYGSTETCAATTVVHWPTERSGLVGLPQPGIELKLVPLDDMRYDVRVKGPSVMRGYLDQPELSKAAFDEEGYYAMGDAVTFVDPGCPHEGLAFAGRVAEEFKLQSGIFVRVGALRVETINTAAPLLMDAVVTGADLPYVGLLGWLNLQAARERFGDLPVAELVRHEPLHVALREAFCEHNRRHSGSSMRVRRIKLLQEPPSMDAGEITDKGYVNQRAVLARRSHEVNALYADAVDDDTVCID